MSSASTGVDERAVPWRAGQHHPARTAAQGLAHGDELVAPFGERSEVTRDRLGQRAGRIAAAGLAKRFEIGFV
jgi:hypothetical protein